MPVTNVEKDADALTMTMTARLDASVERAWQLWADPRQLERWWGPPGYPATVVEHDVAPGGAVRYYMTGPEGDRYNGWWRIEEAEPPRRLRFQDGFADDEGKPNDAMPSTIVTVTLESDGDATTMRIASRFPSREAMDQLAEMGMEEGMKQSLGQIDALLAE